MNWKALSKSRLGFVDELVVEADVELVVLRANTVRSGAGTHLPSGLEDGGKIKVSGLRRATLLVNLQHVGATNHLVDGTEAELGHDSTEIFREVVEEVDHLLGLAGKLGAKLRVLGGDTDRASVD